MERKKDDKLTESIIKWLTGEKPAKIIIKEMNDADDEEFHPKKVTVEQGEEKKEEAN